MSVSLPHDRPYKAIGRSSVLLRFMGIAWVGVVLTARSGPCLIAAQGDSQACARIILEIASGRPEGLDERACRDDVRRPIKTHHGESAGEFPIAEFVFRLFSLQHKVPAPRNAGIRERHMGAGHVRGLGQAALPGSRFPGRGACLPDLGVGRGGPGRDRMIEDRRQSPHAKVIGRRPC